LVVHPGQRRAHRQSEQQRGPPLGAQGLDVGQRALLVELPVLGLPEAVLSRAPQLDAVLLTMCSFASISESIPK
jgi:hypothetical protein